MNTEFLEQICDIIRDKFVEDNQQDNQQDDQKITKNVISKQMSEKEFYRKQGELYYKLRNKIDIYDTIKELINLNRKYFNR